jgi:hypothetical protein
VPLSLPLLEPSLEDAAVVVVGVVVMVAVDAWPTDSQEPD